MQSQRKIVMSSIGFDDNGVFHITLEGEASMGNHLNVLDSLKRGMDEEYEEIPVL